MSLLDSFAAGSKAEQGKKQLILDNILYNAVNKDDLRSKIARLIVSNSLSHRLVESSEFKDVILAANPMAADALFKSHSSIPPRIKANFLQQQQAVKQLLSTSLSYIHLCTDSWTAGPIHHMEFQAINAQFVDQDGQLRKTLLTLPELTNGHSGETVTPHVIEVLQTYEIHHNCGWITADNHGANDTLCRALEAWFEGNNLVYLKATSRRLRCLGHIINLAVQAFLFATSQQAVDTALQRVSNSQQSDLSDDYFVGLTNSELSGSWASSPALEKIYKTAVQLRKSRYFKAFKELLMLWPHCPQTVLTMPGETRWNGWFLLIR
jgi:hypothetical protein